MAKTLSDKCGITLPQPQRTRRIPQHLEDSCIDTKIFTTTETSTENYRTHVYYVTIDALLEEIGNRFNELNLSLLKALDALVPKSDLFLHMPTLQPFLAHYSISEVALSSEVPIFRSFLRAGM